MERKKMKKNVFFFICLDEEKLKRKKIGVILK